MAMLFGMKPRIAASQVPDTSVDVTGGSNSMTQTYVGVPDRRTLTISACAEVDSPEAPARFDRCVGSKAIGFAVVRWRP
jgi:hypothetical protein